jgi:hypothetical protein
MASGIYQSFNLYKGDGTIDLDGDAFKIALVESGYTPDYANHDAFATHITNEVSGGNYAAGGVAVTPSWTKSGATCAFTVSAAQWSALTATFRYAVLYSVTSGKLVCCWDYTTDQSITNGTLTLTASDGVFDSVISA